eukprot:scaffold921_cov126-Cylindrotheca_fusiformis.AAC.17
MKRHIFLLLDERRESCCKGFTTPMDKIVPLTGIWSKLNDPRNKYVLPHRTLSAIQEFSSNDKSHDTSDQES